MTARGQLENLFISGRIILKWVLSILNRTMGTGFMCLMIGKLAASWKEGIELTDCMSRGIHLEYLKKYSLLKNSSAFTLYRTVVAVLV